LSLALKVPIKGILLRSVSVNFCKDAAAYGPWRAIKARLSSSKALQFKFYLEITLLIWSISIYLFPAFTTILTSSYFSMLAAIASSIIPAESVKNIVK
jgi:hypothetical protein